MKDLLDCFFCSVGLIMLLYLIAGFFVEFFQFFFAI